MDAHAGREFGQHPQIEMLFEPFAELVRGKHDPQTGADCAAGMIVLAVLFARLEHHHDAVADQLRDATAVAHDRLAHRFEIGVEQFGDLTRTEAL